MAIDFLHHLDLNQNQVKNVVIDNLTSDAFKELNANDEAGTAPVAGQAVFITTTSKFRFYDGSAWVTLGETLTAAEVRAMFEVSDTGGDGSLAYDKDTGKFTYTGPSATEVRAHFSNGTGITITDGQIATTITQYADADVQAYISEGTGVSISSAGQISIGQKVATDSDVSFNTVSAEGDIVSKKGNLSIEGNAVIKGNLSVEGDTVTVNQTQVNVTNAFVFEGATADEFETTLTIEEPTKDQSIALPDASGTIALTSQLNPFDAADAKTAVGEMVTGNTETGLSVTYQETDQTLDFKLTADPTITLTGDVTGSGTMTNLGDVSITLDTVKNKAYSSLMPKEAASNSFAVAHGLGTDNVIVQLYKGGKLIYADVTVKDKETVLLEFAKDQAAGTIKVNILSAAV
jgi:hypothetical protein